MEGWNEVCDESVIRSQQSTNIDQQITRSPVIRPPKSPSTKPATVSCTVFDEQSDIVWVGDSSVR